MAWVIHIACSHWKTKSSQAIFIAESTPFLQLQKNKTALPASNRKEQSMDQKLQHARGWRNWSCLLSPEYHWLQGTRKRRAYERRDTLLIGKFYKDFSLTAGFWAGCLGCSSLPVTGFVDPQHCATTPVLQAAEETALHPCFNQGGTASWHTPTPWQWPDWGYLKASCELHSCELRFSSKSCVLWSPLLMSALLALAKENDGVSGTKKKKKTHQKTKTNNKPTKPFPGTAFSSHQIQ